MQHTGYSTDAPLQQCSAYSVAGTLWHSAKYTMDVPARIPSLRDNGSEREYQGNIVVNGDIENTSFTVRGNLQCNGSVRASNIIVLGNASIEGECLQSSLHVGGTMRLRIADRADIVCDGDVHLLTRCSESVIRATGSIHALKATISGGRYTAGGSIRLRRARMGEDGTPLLLHAAHQELRTRCDERFRQRIEALEQDIDTKNEVMQTQLRSLQNRQLSTWQNIMPDDPILRRVRREEEELKEQLRLLWKEYTLLRQHQQKDIHLCIAAMAEQGIELAINNRRIRLDEPCLASRFTLSVDEKTIEQSPYTTAADSAASI